MKVIQKAKTIPKSYVKKQASGMSCRASCKKCPPMTC